MVKGKVKGFILVRDKDGNPKFDNKEIPKEIWDSLSDIDKRKLKDGGHSPRNN